MVMYRKTPAFRLVGVVSILLIVVLASCKPSQGAEVDSLLDQPDLLPVILFQDGLGIGSRAIPQTSSIPEGMEEGEFLYLMMAPVVTGFQPNTSSHRSGSTLEYDFLDTTMIVTISRSEGTFTFDGNLENGSGWMKLVYTPSTKIFSYEHAFHVYDKDMARENSGKIEFINYLKMENIEVDQENAFLGNFSTFISFRNRDDNDEIMIESQGMQAFYNGEIYSGKMKLSGIQEEFSGVGVATFFAYWDPAYEPIDSLDSIDILEADLATLKETYVGARGPNPFIVIKSAEGINFTTSSQGDGSDASFAAFGFEDYDSMYSAIVNEEEFATLLPTLGWQENTKLPGIQK